MSALACDVVSSSSCPPLSDLQSYVNRVIEYSRSYGVEPAEKRRKLEEMIEEGLKMLSQAPPRSPPHLHLHALLISPLRPSDSLPLYEASLKLSARTHGPEWDDYGEALQQTSSPLATSAFTKSSTVRGLRCLSTLARLGSDPASSTAHAKLALTRALKEADEGEVKECWKSVALANVSGFFGGGEGDLEKALRAFDLASQSDPDVPYNRGVVLEYLERFGQAADAFRDAHGIDPHGIDGGERAATIDKWLEKVRDVVGKGGGMKEKRAKQLVKGLLGRVSPP
eukprot:CAMPEP_0182460594 /NCGR_PEP_ID=MMETSP1319-20130603/5426_1 /TAXON_ID=172717 /ORGANISM="Bolidomonas pacifica, Strain RCC208" /LENGTH=282 /DNA_ID=CAMNT_0024659727 /DNA_START=41 /DNA_END=886 /DNA_ORIENTATION=-